jgi:hypothetical protein
MPDTSQQQDAVSASAGPQEGEVNQLPTNDKKIEWNDQLEGIVSREGEKAQCYYWMHLQAEKKYARLNTLMALPVIVLSTLSGTLSVASPSLFGTNNSAASAGIGFGTIGVSILSTIQNFFGWAKRQEGHRMAALHYSKLYRYLSIELALPRDTRTPAKHLIKFVREQVDRLGEVSPIIPDDVVGKFNHLFGATTPEITKPEITNGLEAIHVYNTTLRGPAPPSRPMTIEIHPVSMDAASSTEPL